MPCNHTTWHADVQVQTNEMLAQRTAFVRITCAGCGKAFKSRGPILNNAGDPGLVIFELQGVDELVRPVIITPGNERRLM